MQSHCTSRGKKELIPNHPGEFMQSRCTSRGKKELIPNHPGGMSAISRGSSAATPPECDRAQQTTPEGSQRGRLMHDTLRYDGLASTPPGSKNIGRRVTGGVAALSHRLMAPTPAGLTGGTKSRRVRVWEFSGGRTSSSASAS